MVEKLPKEIVTEISTNLATDIHVQIQEAEQTSNMINLTNPIPRCIIKLSKIKKKSIHKKPNLYKKDNLNASGLFHQTTWRPEGSDRIFFSSSE